MSGCDPPPPYKRLAQERLFQSTCRPTCLALWSSESPCTITPIVSTKHIYAAAPIYTWITFAFINFYKIQIKNDSMILKSICNVSLFFIGGSNYQMTKNTTNSLQNLTKEFFKVPV